MIHVSPPKEISALFISMLSPLSTSLSHFPIQNSSIHILSSSSSSPQPHSHSRSCSCALPLSRRPQRRTFKSLASPSPSPSSRSASIQLHPDEIETAPCPVAIQAEEDVQDFTTLLVSSLRSSATLPQVKRLHALAIRLSLSHLTYVAKDLLYAYIRVEQLEYAHKVFDAMSSRDVVSYSMLLEGYRLMGSADKVLHLFTDMVDNGIAANSYTYVSLLKLCAEQGDFELGRQLHACAVKADSINLIVQSVLVHFYAQFADIQSASVMFHRMSKRDVVAWTTIIVAYVQHGNAQEAFSMLSTMQNDGFSPNEFTISCVLKACMDEKALKCGRQLHGGIVKGRFRDDVYVGSSLLAMYARCGEISDARLVFDKMTRRNSITWTSMIFGYAQNGLGYEAISLFHKMKDRRVWAVRETILSILYACGSLQSIYIAKEIHAQVIKNLFSEDIRFATTLIWVYCKCCEYGYAEKILEKMSERDTVSWTALISGFKNLGQNVEALELLADMLCDGVQPNDFTYSSALGACAKLETTRYGQRIHAFVNKHEQTLSNVFVGTSLLDMYMKCGNVRDAQSVFDQMAERNAVTWKLLILGYVNNGMSTEAFKYMRKMQEEGWEVDEFVRAIVMSAFGDVDESELSTGSLVER